MIKKMLSLFWIFSLLQFATGFEQLQPEVYLIPYGFKGKVNIIFNQPKGSAVKYQNGKRVYEIPPNGILLTKFKDEQEIVNHEYYYIDSIGTKTRLTIFSNSEEDTATGIGIFRDGTVGVYGDSDDPKSLSYQEFYVTSGKEFKTYFTHHYQTAFDEKVRLATGYKF